MEWTLSEIEVKARQKKDDTWNCGVIVSQYLKRLSICDLELDFSTTFKNLEIIRMDMANTIEENSMKI